MRRHILTAVVGLALAGCNSGGAECTMSSQCETGYYCSQSQCRRDCRVDLECPGGTCDTKRGRCVVDADGGALDDMGDSDGGGPTTDGGTTTGLGYGELCSEASQCASGYCSPNPFAASDHECTSLDCSSCMLGDFCVADTTCAQSDVGAPCNLANGGADCRSGLCLGDANGSPAFCTRECTTAAQCPAGYACSLAGGHHVCVNVDATDTVDCSIAPCWYGTLCDATQKSSTQPHYPFTARCLAECESLGQAGCPLYHTCTNALIPGHQVCAPNFAQGKGGMWAACQSYEDCRTGACLANHCFTSCGATTSVGQWCPNGWGCNPGPFDTGSGVEWHLGCLGSGAGSIGANCLDNTSCASGLCDGTGVCTRYCHAGSGLCPSHLPNCSPVTDDYGQPVIVDGVALKTCVH